MPQDQQKRLKIEVVEDKQESQNNLPKKPEKITPEVSRETDSPESDKLPFWILFFTFIFGLAIGSGLIGGIFFYKSRISKIPPSQTPKPQFQDEPTLPPQTPSPSPEINFNIKISVLNGSGIKGEASKVEELLKKAGFKNITTGNAKTYDYIETVIIVKKTVTKEISDLVINTLSIYKIKEGTELPTTSDIQIIVGNGKK